MKTSVLIVDNEKNIRNSLVKVLSGDYQTYEAVNGREALDVLSTHRDIQVVLSDVMMPEMGGIELTEELRSENEDIIIIIMTADPDEKKEKEALDKGADYFLPKPIDLKKLEITIQTLLKIRNSRKNFFAFPSMKTFTQKRGEELEGLYTGLQERLKYL